ncbi:reverse transcriptase domain-containing protein [Tanacetum coccineum]
MKDQPLSADASPTALSPGHIADSNPEKDKEDPEEDPADRITEFTATLPSSSPPPENVEDNIRPERCGLMLRGLLPFMRRKTNMARKSISQTEQQAYNGSIVNANNKRSWKDQRTHACYECGSLRHFKSECPIVKFQKRVDKKIRTLAERQTENKRKGTGNANAVNNQRVTVASQKAICYECKNQGHYKRDCPERKNQSHKNQIGGTGAHGVVRTLRGGETDQDPNNKKDEIEA